MFGLFKKSSRDAAPRPSAEAQLQFSRQLQAVTNKIHATENLDQLMLDLSREICDLFHCDRLTMYAVSRDKRAIFSKVKTGIDTNRDLTLPIDSNSIAGYVALSERTLRIADVYDERELKAIAPELALCREVDHITGYRTRQMLAAPIVHPHSHTLLGVIQLLNNRNDGAFPEMAELGLRELCETLAIAFAQRMKAAAQTLSKYQPLVVDAIISQAELELAVNWARRKNQDIETALVDEFQVALNALGNALAKTYRLPYERFTPDRQKPADALSKFDRRFAERTKCVPIEAAGANVVFMSIDPECHAAQSALRERFTYNNLFFRVTTKREFEQTLDRYFNTGG